MGGSADETSRGRACRARSHTSSTGLGVVLAESTARKGRVGQAAVAMNSEGAPGFTVNSKGWGGEGRSADRRRGPRQGKVRGGRSGGRPIRRGHALALVASLRAGAGDGDEAAEVKYRRGLLWLWERQEAHTVLASVCVPPNAFEQIRGGDAGSRTHDALREDPRRARGGRQLAEFMGLCQGAAQRVCPRAHVAAQRPCTEQRG